MDVDHCSQAKKLFVTNSRVAPRTVSSVFVCVCVSVSVCVSVCVCMCLCVCVCV